MIGSGSTYYILQMLSLFENKNDSTLEKTPIFFVRLIIQDLWRNASRLTLRGVDDCHKLSQVRTSAPYSLFLEKTIKVYNSNDNIKQK